MSMRFLSNARIHDLPLQNDIRANLVNYQMAIIIENSIKLAILIETGKKQQLVVPRTDQNILNIEFDLCHKH